MRVQVQVQMRVGVRMGEGDFSSTTEPNQHVEHKVVRKVVHPKYNFFTYENDLALVRTERRVTFADNIIPICLPPPDIALTGKIGLVAGWGKTDNSFGKTGTNILHKVLVPIIKNDECIRWHEDKNILVQVPCNYHIK